MVVFLYIVYINMYKAGKYMDILQKIIEIDKAAAAQAELAVEAEFHEIKALEDKRLRRRQKRLEEEQIKFDELRTEQERLLNEKKNGSQAAIAETTGRLDEIFAQHREQWQSEIMQRITGV